MTKQMFAALALAFGVFAPSGSARAAEPTPTTISIPEMHCGGCAKKVTTKLTELPGVAQAEADMKAKTITVTPKPGATLSPKGVWEAVEQAGQVPTKLTGPGGTFTKKPQS
jgi:copper chaperone CopZ